LSYKIAWKCEHFFLKALALPRVLRRAATQESSPPRLLRLD
jgi:hypothetical protein